MAMFRAKPYRPLPATLGEGEGEGEGEGTATRTLPRDSCDISFGLSRIPLDNICV